MALSHLSLDTDKYEIFISNFSTEETLENDQLSSADSWTTTLDSSIDLSTLLYLKSSTAEVCVSQLNVDSLPLCFTQLEDVKMKITMPEELAKCNQYYGSDALKSKFNPITYVIPLENFSTSEPDAAIAFLNEKLGLSISHFVLRSSLRIVLDTEIFVEKQFTTLSLKDIKLIIRYLDCILFSRHILHSYLHTQMGTTEDINKKITFLQKEPLKSGTEEKTIKESETLRPTANRTQPRISNNMDLTQFEGVNLEKAYTETAETGPKKKIESRTQTWLDNLGIIERVDENDPNSALTSTCIDEVQKIVDSNKGLIEQAIKCREILSLLQKFQDKRTKESTSELFHKSLITLTLDLNNSKLHYIDNTNLFLADNGTSINLEFPPYCSYKLGANKGKLITIGPLYHSVSIKPNTPKLTNNLTNPTQSPFSPVRPMPRLIYVATDFVSTLSRDLWLKNTGYESCHLIFCLHVDETQILNRFLCKTDNEKQYYRISNLKSLLNSFTINIIDENFQKIFFQQRTISRIALIIKPLITDVK